MRAMAEQLGTRWKEYANISPTIYGGAESLESQSMPRSFAEPFTGCNAGHTSFHVDPHGRASICKVGRDPRHSPGPTKGKKGSAGSAESPTSSCGARAGVRRDAPSVPSAVPACPCG